jgi:DNA-binding CsgD family transcriptional regulator
MIAKSDQLRRRFSPMLCKSLKIALSHRIAKEFPRIGGDRICELCAEMVLEVVGQHMRTAESVQHGQCLWMGVSIEDPPTRGKRLRDTDLVPVVLDLCTPDDIQAILDRKAASERMLNKAIRLCEQAHAQGALLSNADLSVIMNRADSQIATLLAEHERETQKVVPRRATLHDMGTGLTHKRIICWKRYAEGKSSEQIAIETRHSIEAVDRYLGDFARVRNCRRQGMAQEQIAFTLEHGINLVKQYLEIDDELEDRNDLHSAKR